MHFCVLLSHTKHKYLIVIPCFVCKILCSRRIKVLVTNGRVQLPGWLQSAHSLINCPKRQFICFSKDRAILKSIRSTRDEAMEINVSLRHQDLFFVTQSKSKRVGWILSINLIINLVSQLVTMSSQALNCNHCKVLQSVMDPLNDNYSDIVAG